MELAVVGLGADADARQRTQEPIEGAGMGAGGLGVLLGGFGPSPSRSTMPSLAAT